MDERPSPGERPGAVTAAGVLEIVLGSLLVLFGFALLARVGGLIVLITLVQGALDVTAGIMILQLRNAGRILGIVMASIGVAGALLTLAGQAAAGSIILVLIGAALRVLIIVWLVQNRGAFVR